jgi:adenine-specific DNA-methyltransferase
MYPSNESLMLSPKILLRQTSDIIRCCYDEAGYYCQNSVFIVHSKTVELKLLVALLNSSLLGVVYRLKNPQAGKVFAEIKPSVIKELPIFDTTKGDAASHSICAKIVSLVEHMLSSKKQLITAQSDKDKDFYENKCAGIDLQIDALVYELYGLTKSESKSLKELP